MLRDGEVPYGRDHRCIAYIRDQIEWWNAGNTQSGNEKGSKGKRHFSAQAAEFIHLDRSGCLFNRP